MAAETVVEPPRSSLTGVARVLVNAGKLTAKTAEELAKMARERKSSFVAAIMSAGVLKPDELAHTLSSALALPLLDLNALDLQRLPRNLVDPKIASQYQLVVLGRRGNRLFIGAADPTDQEAAERIKFATQLTPEWVIVEHDKLA
ncbi:MAG: type IV-A pilus assembly ATPase PilB, partial [Comamonadaceae bacterium]|nr:type IV-A pilus assembly ATPase PilB [Comamonadaceae bacterium]